MELYKENIVERLKEMRTNSRRIPPFVGIDVSDNRILIVAEKSDETELQMDEFENGERLETPSRNVIEVLIEELEDIETKKKCVNYEDKKAIHIIHCNKIEEDINKLTSIIYNCDLVLVIVNNRVLLLKDVNKYLRNKKAIEYPIGL